MVVMMDNPDDVNDWIEVDRMNVDLRHLEMVVENKAVENRLHLNWRIFDSLIDRN
jgi:hypothetical protein